MTLKAKFKNFLKNYVLFVNNNNIIIIYFQLLKLKYFLYKI